MSNVLSVAVGRAVYNSIQAKANSLGTGLTLAAAVTALRKGEPYDRLTEKQQALFVDVGLAAVQALQVAREAGG